MRIVVAHPDGSWWEAARRDPNRPKAADPLVEGRTRLVVSDQEAVFLEMWAKSLPGWNDRAPALTFEPPRPI
jgi:hypothetical protein